MTKQWDAVVIGGGHNGLVAAAYLAKNGLDTLVCEWRGVFGMLFPNVDRRVRGGVRAGGTATRRRW